VDGNVQSDHGLIQGLCPGKNWTNGLVRGLEWPVILRAGLNLNEPVDYM
jgi:hypothetical protein